MSTPRTIKASEVREGMRVRVEESLGGRTTQVTEGLVMADATPYNAEYFDLELDGATFGIAGDHPVTVLAEPEPEWVEGAWYRVRYESHERLAVRVDGGFSLGGDRPTWTDQARRLTVLGRVLIVDWPGDDVASGVEADNPPQTEPTDTTAGDYAVQIFADAIRAQGGVR